MTPARLDRRGYEFTARAAKVVKLLALVLALGGCGYQRVLKPARASTSCAQTPSPNQVDVWVRDGSAGYRCERIQVPGLRPERFGIVVVPPGNGEASDLRSPEGRCSPRPSS